MLNTEAEAEAEEVERRRKLEEALEVKALRRIISAFINYPEASEEDIKRYERSFRKLPQAHKVILSHLPLKFQKLRWCIAQNSYFIFEMLKAFEPPLDLSQDTDICEDQHLDNITTRCCGLNCKESVKPSSEEHGGGISGTCVAIKEEKIEHSNELNDVSLSSGLKHQNNTNSVGNDWCKEFQDLGKQFPSASCNENISSSSPGWLSPLSQSHVPLVDVDKVRCIIRNIVRDWAAEGQKERDQCYKPILEELERLFPNRCKESPPTCLVPGAGLGRLALEISCLGFVSQGNEFSYYMMICSSFILNVTQTAKEWTIFPWIHSNCNSLSDNDQLRPVSIPDIHPASAGITEGFSMCGGDFVEVYSDPSQEGYWDAVVTCFFLDTAHNIVEYIEVISKILKDGGVWINLGPLLYHFADMYSLEDEMSIELSLEDVKKVALHYGFEFVKESTIETTYTTNPRSMMQNRYYTAFWTMRKKTNPA
nr:carnosine N-methyltransferase isoform X1 [Ipomoea batatas]